MQQIKRVAYTCNERYIRLASVNDTIVESWLQWSDVRTFTCARVQACTRVDCISTILQLGSFEYREHWIEEGKACGVFDRFLSVIYVISFRIVTHSTFVATIKMITAKTAYCNSDCSPSSQNIESKGKSLRCLWPISLRNLCYFFEMITVKCARNERLIVFWINWKMLLQLSECDLSAERFELEDDQVSVYECSIQHWIPLIEQSQCRRQKYTCERRHGQSTYADFIVKYVLPGFC